MDKKTNEESFFTPGPWTVYANLDHYGQYEVAEAVREQDDWVNEGWNIGDEEGERRQEIANRHDAGNARLIAAAPDLLAACKLALAQDADDDTIFNALAIAVAKAEGEEA
jgi:hypothetical protein